MDTIYRPLTRHHALDDLRDAIADAQAQLTKLASQLADLRAVAARLGAVFPGLREPTTAEVLGVAPEVRS